MTDNFKHIDKGVEFVAKHYKPNTFDSRKGWEKMQQHIAPERKIRKLSVFYSAAAAVALLLVVSILYLTSDMGETLVAKTDNKVFVLPDSSYIQMKKGAELQYDKHFDDTDRQVSMTGEISFAVARNEKKPFIVTTPTAEVRVLGTEFTVDADESETRINVSSGKVQFTPDSPAIPLLCTAGMTVHYTAENENVKVTSPHATMEINGKNKSLTFNNAQLKEIVLVLSHFYNVKLELPEEEATLTFTSSFTQKSVIEIINIINLTLDTHVKIEN